MNSTALEKRTFRIGSLMWSAGGIVFMAFMLWSVPSDAKLPPSIESLQPLANHIGTRGTIFVAGWAVWSLAGMVSMWRLAKVVARNQQMQR